MSSRVIAVLNQKGGVGKTTTAVNLAAALTGKNTSVLLVDLDPQGNATSGLGVAKEQLTATAYEVLLSQATLNLVIQKIKAQNFYLLPANQNLAGAEVELVNLPNRELRLSQAIAATNFDYIIIDCPPALSLLTINALSAAHYVLIPVQAEYYALEGLGQLLGTVQAVQGSSNPNLELLGVLLTMYDKRNSLSNQVLKELKNYFGTKLFSTTIPRNVRLAESPSFGKTIFEHDKWSKGARAYKQFAKEVEKSVG